MTNTSDPQKGCSCCSGNAFENLTGGIHATPQASASMGGITRAGFLKIIGVAGLTTLVGNLAHAEPSADTNTTIVKGDRNDLMIIDKTNRELRISATVTKDVTKPSVADWGRRFQAFFGVWGGKMEGFFVFTTGVSRVGIDRALHEIGIRSRRQIPMDEVEQRRGLKATTTIADYLDGDPVICTIRFKKDDKIVEGAMEDFIMEKIVVDGAEVIKPYTPHFIYHGTGEAINFPSGCVVCPSDCNGGIITDNVLPLKTTVNYYKVNWDLMPPVDAKVEVVLKSIYGPQPMSTVG
jgi:hypothetical protein